MSWIAFTVDVEEWFHILDTDAAPPVARWDEQSERVVRNTLRLLDMLDEVGVRGTFFFLGWVAEQHPQLVREVAARGHEVACHGHEHLLAFRVGRAAFEEDARRAKKVLEDTTGATVLGYRAAGFSITRETPWAFDVLAEAGFRYDSSVFPARRGHGGYPSAPSVPHRVRGPEGGTLLEFPVAPLRLGPVRVPFSGGGYLRLLPATVVRGCLSRLLASGAPANIYVHPREVDADHPRLPLSRKRSFMTYVNVRRGQEKISALLRSFPAERFRRLSDVREELEAETALPQVTV